MSPLEAASDAILRAISIRNCEIAGADPSFDRWDEFDAMVARKHAVLAIHTYLKACASGKTRNALRELLLRIVVRGFDNAHFVDEAADVIFAALEPKE